MIDFGEVRSILHSGEEALSWGKLCELCARATQAEWDEQLSPYVMPVVSRLPTARRGMPPLWLRRAMEGGELPACVPLAANIKLALTTQSMTGQFDLRRLERLANPSLRAISLSARGLDPKRYKDKVDVSGLLGSSALTGLRELTLGDDLATEGVLRRLASNEALRGVEALGLTGMSFTRHIINALELFPSASSGQLRALRLTRCDGLTPEIGRSDLWGGLTSLTIEEESWSGVSDHGFAAALRGDKLRSLNLRHIRQNALHLKLFESDYCDNIETLCIEHININNLNLIWRDPKRWKLRALIWSDLSTLTEETRAQFAALVRGGEAFVRLEAMQLDPRTAAALFEAARGASLPALRVLRLGRATSSQLAALAACHMPALRTLMVQLDREDGDPRDALAALMEAPWWAQLESLQLGYNDWLDTLRVWLEPRWARAGLSIGYAPIGEPLWDDVGDLAI